MHASSTRPMHASSNDTKGRAGTLAAGPSNRRTAPRLRFRVRGQLLMPRVYAANKRLRLPPAPPSAAAS
jgi:hypothetical protein